EVKEFIKGVDIKFASKETQASYEIIRLKILAAHEAIGLLNQIVSGAEARGASSSLSGKAKYLRLKGTVEFITGSDPKFLIILGEAEDRQKIKNLIADMEDNLATDSVKATGKVVRLYPLQYQKSTDVVAMLNQLRSSGPGSSSAIIDPDVAIINNTQVNAILVNAPMGKQESIGAIIRQLDLRVVQILVEVKIVELTLQDSFNWGIDFQNITWDRILNIGKAAGKLDFSTSTGVGGTFSVNAPDPLSIITFLGEVGKVNIVSTPNLLTLDNQRSEISITDRKAVKKEDIQLSSNPNIANQIFTKYEYIDAGLKLSVTPHVNDVSNVTLEVDQSIDSFSVINTAGYPDITSRKLTSRIIVGDRTTAILGGLYQTREDTAESGTPGLMKIPILGLLFKKIQKKKVNSELLIFLTPYILSDDTQLRNISEKKLMESLVNIQKKNETGSKTNQKPAPKPLFPPPVKKVEPAKPGTNR
ncbi:MAG: hypothetical protein JNM63_05575, partial [Spirochaetia bacterium]|nr:hypothetical protein [Spirochaetia bacterium]